MLQLEDNNKSQDRPGIPWRGDRARARKVQGDWYIYAPNSRANRVIRAAGLPPFILPATYGDHQISLEELEWAFHVGLGEEEEQIRLLLHLESLIGTRPAELNGFVQGDLHPIPADADVVGYPLYLADGTTERPVAYLDMTKQWLAAEHRYGTPKNSAERKLFLTTGAYAIALRLLEIATQRRDEAIAHARVQLRRGKIAELPCFPSDEAVPIFCSRQGGPDDIQKLNDALARVLLRAGFPELRSIDLARVHGIRHLVGSLYYGFSGEDAIATAAFIGDTEAEVRRTYIHAPKPRVIQIGLVLQRTVLDAPRYREMAERGELRALREHVEMARQAALDRDVDAVARMGEAVLADSHRIRERFDAEPSPQLRAELLDASQKLQELADFAARAGAESLAGATVPAAPSHARRRDRRRPTTRVARLGGRITPKQRSGGEPRWPAATSENSPPSGTGTAA